MLKAIIFSVLFGEMLNPMLVLTVSSIVIYCMYICVYGYFQINKLFHIFNFNFNSFYFV